MITVHGLARLGRDPELRYTNSGDAVANLSLAFSWGKRDEAGKRATTWVDASLWGKRAEALAPFLMKGGQVAVSMEDLHIETFQGRNGESQKLVARILDIDLAGGGEQGQPRPPAQPSRPPARAASAPAPRTPATAAAPTGGGSGFDDLDGDIPF